MEDPTNQNAEACRKSGWRSFVLDLEDDFSAEGDGDNDDDGQSKITPGIMSKGATSMAMPTLGCDPSPRWFAPRVIAKSDGLRPVPSGSWPRPFPPWEGPPLPAHTRGEVLTMNGWVAIHRRDLAGNGPAEINERRRYLDKAVSLLLSLAKKVGGGDDGGEVMHPSFINGDNVLVRKSTFMGKEELVVDFEKRGDSIFSDSDESKARREYRAMDALGKIAYGMFMLGEGTSLSKICPKPSAATARRVSDVLSIGNEMTETDADMDEEDNIIDMLRKNPRTLTSEGEKHDGIVSVMLDAKVPFPLCRFVSDLLDGGDRTPGCSMRSFSSFADVLSDLNQMVVDPGAFLHASSPERWRLAFGEKLYGREGVLGVFMDVAGRVAYTHEDPIFDGLSALRGKRRAVIMVSGPGGAGKSRLVGRAGTDLEGRGWRFLQCKFDRVVHPEPLSVVASAFDKCFRSLAGCPVRGAGDCGDLPPLTPSLEPEAQDIRERLERIIGQEGLGTLVKHVPSLRYFLKASIPEDSTVEPNEAMMHTLFGKLLRVLASEQTPVLFFIDDLQWADTLSLAMLSALVRGANLDLLNLSHVDREKNCSANAEKDIRVMFVGSYRDNEVGHDHQLAKVLRGFKADSFITVTDISISGLNVETLNEMLSELLCVPVRRVRSLTDIVIQKTDGQPLHVIEFIRALVSDNLLTHSFVRGWEWDADSIDICPITDSVAELFSFKLRKLSEDTLLGLQILSCFGSQIDQRMLKFTAGYDGESSVDIVVAIDVALSEGLMERAAHLVCFSHDLIQNAAIDSIGKDALIPLLRKLVSALIRNASAVGELDSILYVVVDLINRIGSDATSSPEESALFAELNSRAGCKAISVPDFPSAARYAENGITFLSEAHWEGQYDLSLCLYETAVLSHFSNQEGNRGLLKERMDAVFDHAKDFSDKCKTHCVWIKLLSMTDVSRAIEESLTALKRLGEPLNVENLDYGAVHEELVKTREQFFGEKKKKLLSRGQMADCNKRRAMKIMSSLSLYYHMRRSILGPFVSCQMVKMSIDHGHSEGAVYGAAAFASSLISVLDDIPEGTAWGRTSLSLMEKYDKNILIPSVYPPLYGIVFVWTDPIQSTMEPLAQGIRSSFATGNVEFAMINTICYTARCFNGGKNIRVLTGEVEALARLHGNHFGNDSSSGSPVYSPLLQFYLTPLYNTLRSLSGSKETSVENDSAFPLNKVKLVNNHDILMATLETGQISCLYTRVSDQTAESLLMRDMDSALKYTDMYYEHFVIKDLNQRYNFIYNDFYEALVTLHFLRQTGEDSYRIRAENAIMKMKQWSKHSDWNFKNKLLLMEAEMHHSQREFDEAAVCYEASIQAAREHKLVHEEAIASELAGIFFFERGLHPKSYKLFMQSIACYDKWGARAVARRVKESIQDMFDLDLMQLFPIDTIMVPPAVLSSGETQSKKRPAG